MADAEDGSGGAYVCEYPKCGMQFQSERTLAKHIASEHRGDGGKFNFSILREGTALEGSIKVTNGGGYTVEEGTPIDLMNTLRRILTNSGVRDKRENVVELFEYEDPRDIAALDRILAMADVTISKRKMIVSLWRNQMVAQGTQYEEDGSPSGIYGDSKKKPQANPMSARPEDMIDWGPGDWMQQMLTMKKMASALNMQAKMMEMFFGDSGNSAGGMGGGSSNAKLPADVQERLRKAEALEAEVERMREAERFQKQMEPVLSELRAIRSERETVDTKNPKIAALEAELDKIKEAERRQKEMEPLLREIRTLRAMQEEAEEKRGSPQKTPMEEFKEFSMMQAMMKSMGNPEAAEMFRAKADERIAMMKMEQEKEARMFQMEQERMRNENHTLQLQNVKTDMQAQLTIMQNQAALANRSKSDDLVSTIKQAQEVTQALKSIGGTTEPVESSDDKKMKAIGDIISSATQTMAPVLKELAKGMGSKGGGQQMGQPGMQAPNYGGQQMPPVPRNQGNKNLVSAQCSRCGNDFEADLSKPSATCSTCGATYQLSSQEPTAQAPAAARPAPRPAPQASSGDTLMKKRQQLLSMDMSTLFEAANTMGVDTSTFESKEEIVEAMLRASGQ